MPYSFKSGSRPCPTDLPWLPEQTGGFGILCSHRSTGVSPAASGAGAFSAKCAICGCDTTARAEIRAALLVAKGKSVMFPMAELDAWHRGVEERVRECPKRHGFFEVWKLLRMLKVKVATPKPAKLETEYYE